MHLAVDRSGSGNRWTSAKRPAQHKGPTIKTYCTLDMESSSITPHSHWVRMTDQLGPASSSGPGLIKVQSVHREKGKSISLFSFSAPLTFPDHIASVGVWEKSQVVCAGVPQGGRSSLKTCCASQWQPSTQQGWDGVQLPTPRLVWFDGFFQAVNEAVEKEQVKLRRRARVILSLVLLHHICVILADEKFFFLSFSLFIKK